MSPYKYEEDIRKTGLRPDPLCLFCYPDESSTVYFGRNTYINTLPKKEPDAWYGTKREEPQKLCDVENEKAKEKEEYWLRRRTQARIRRRRMKEPIRNLKAYLLTSVKNENVPQKTVLPSLFDVLETVRDAWPSPSSTKLKLLRHEGEKSLATQTTIQQSTMKDPQINIQFPSTLLNRRFSMPEELMRKYSVSKERTSEESETNKTMIDISPRSSSSSNLEQEETVRKRETYRIENSVSLDNTEPPKISETLQLSEKVDAYQQTSDSENEKSTKDEKKFKKTAPELPKRVTQYDYYNQGKKIIKIKAVEKRSQARTCTCRSEIVSSATVSAKEESEDSVTSDSIPSSSPTQLPKRESSSDNMSSESSDYINCTCAEITSSKETSTDLFHSGKSTLSQTVSDKSISTQDSTVSINSVSTRGSTVSDNSNSTTPEIEKTSAKETTTSPDYSPRSPRTHMSRKFRRKDKFKTGFHDHKKSCPKYLENTSSRNYLSVNYGRRCPVHSENKTKITITCGTNTEIQLEKPDANIEVEIPKMKEVLQTNQSIQPDATQIPIQQQTEEKYKWAKLSQEELYMMQQLRHKKFVENQQKLLHSFPAESDLTPVNTYGTVSAYKDTSQTDEPIMIPRYSALPRTLSMLVNTSSGDSFHNSDSDNQSLADSLEDQPITHVHKLYYDTKRESKPVRGDASVVQDSKLKYRQPRGRAFFVSIKDPYGEDEMLEHIEKIPQPPDKIKNQISERRLKIYAKHRHLHEPKPTSQPQKQKAEKKRQKKEINNEKQENKKEERKHISRKAKDKQESGETKMKQKETQQINSIPDEGSKITSKRKKDNKSSFGSKIPVLISSRSTSSSPERELETKEKPLARPKIRVRKEKKSEEIIELSKPDIERTQIMEITQSGKELSLQKPQAIIHPSQPPHNEFQEKSQVTIPPLVSSLRIPPPYRQTISRQLLISQARRSPISRFRQRFEVIPEEKSSSLSSAEEKNPKETLPKFTDVSTSPLQKDPQKSDKLEFQSYNVNEVPNLFVAKITNKQLETLPYVKNNEDQKIILFSSKDQSTNSAKGRDALIAMNREDFNRLAKGWMNFYKLSETLDNSENEESCKVKEKDGNKTETESKKILGNELRSERNFKNEWKTHRGNPSDKNDIDETTDTSKCLKNPDLKKTTTDTSAQVNLNKKKSETKHKLNEDIRFHSSNTILRKFEDVSPTNTLRNGIRQSSLPELRVDNFGECEIHKCSSIGDKLPRVCKSLEDSDTDSDSTDYLEPPSPRVPPLPIADFPSDGTISSSDEIEDLKRLSNMKHFQVKKRGCVNRVKPKNDIGTTRLGKKRNSGWSVTVAGTVELSRSAPDLEMRLSFPVKGGPPIVSQSDSGFAEDSNYSKQSESLHDLSFYKSKKEGMKDENMKREWMLTLKKPTQGSNVKEAENSSKSSSYRLPELESSQSKNAKKVLKDSQPELDDKMKRIIEKKMRTIWPKVQKVIKKEFLTESGRLITELYEEEDFCLSVRGNAVSLEKKQKPQTMTERDITRRYTSRKNDEHPS